MYQNAEVWINGEYLGKRPYGFISFSHDLTKHLNFGDEENVISVRVDHYNYADSRWYTASGITRQTWLKIMNPVHVGQWGTFIMTSDRVWINRGDGTFKAIDRNAIRHFSFSSMGVDVSDINRDRHADIFVSEMLSMNLRRRTMQFADHLAPINGRPQYNKNSLYINGAIPPLRKPPGTAGWRPANGRGLPILWMWIWMDLRISS